MKKLRWKKGQTEINLKINLFVAKQKFHVVFKI